MAIPCVSEHIEAASGSKCVLYNADWSDVLPTLDGQVAAIITDPPYGCGIAEWDKPVDVARFLSECKRLCADGFIAFFMMMPYAVRWLAEAESTRLHFLEHIVWVKRLVLPAPRLSRGHESIFVYATGRKRKFYKVQGPYEDVKIPGILVDVVALTSIQRCIAELFRLVRGGKPGMVKSDKTMHTRFHGLPGVRCPRNVNYTNVWSFLPPQRYNVGHQKLLHMTRKPDAIMERLVEMLTQEGDTVVDPFMGSGTTGVACARLGRNFIGIDIDPRSYEVACERIRKAAQEPRQLELEMGYDGQSNC